MALNLNRIVYSRLNHRQKENYNFSKISAKLADYGFITIRLSDDYNGADFIAYHNSGSETYKIQLKGRLFVSDKYKNKDIYGCFIFREVWYIYPHDAFLRWALKMENTNISQTKGFLNIHDWNELKGSYTWPSPTEAILRWLKPYAIE